MAEQGDRVDGSATAAGRVLVTGASGHLGANLVRRLLDEGQQVRVLVRQGSNNEAVRGLDLEQMEGDLRDYWAVRRAIDGCSHVYHCAARLSTLYPDAREERTIYDCNVLGTRHVLQAARELNVQRVVVTGSFSATGYDLDDPTRPANEDQPYYPFARPMPYEHTKAFVEHECLRAFAEGVNVVVATSCAILGPNDFKPSRMGRVLIDFAAGRLRAFIPGGFEFVTTRDIVEGHVLAMQKGRAGQKYIFASRFLTLDELMGYYEEVTGKKRPRLRLPAPLMAQLSEVSSFVMTTFFPQLPQRLTPGAVRILRMQRRADCSKAKRELGYRPTSVLEALGEAYQDFVQRGLIARKRTASAGSCHSSAAKPNTSP